MNAMNAKNSKLRGLMLHRPMYIIGVITVCILIGIYWYTTIQNRGNLPGMAKADRQDQLQAVNVPGIQPAAWVTPAAKGRSFPRIVEGVLPSVVDVSATQKGFNTPTITQPQIPGTRFADPFGNKAMESVGSGLIVASDGYVITNFHVIENANEIWVTLFNADGTTNRYDADLVLQDKKRELALLKIQTRQALSPVTFGSSEGMRVGEGVIAIGTPFGLSHSVSQGIISSKRNTLTIAGEVHKNLIQTDVAINKGNSGGPLINRRGEVIGINTAIYSTTGSFTGISFAIPSEHVVEFLENGMPHPPKLLDTPPVQPMVMTPGGAAGMHVAQPVVEPNPARWLGLDLASMDLQLAQQQNAPYPDGALVQAVLPDSPAAKAGFLVGDQIFKLDGRRITTPKAFLKQLLAGEPEEARVAIVRAGKRQNLMLSVTTPPPSYVQQQANATSNAVSVAVAAPMVNGGAGGPAITDFSWMGLAMSPIDAALRVKNNATQNLSGAWVKEVKPGSEAEIAGLKAGDVIFAINNQPVIDASTLASAIQTARNAKTILLEVGRNNKRMFASLL